MTSLAVCLESAACTIAPQLIYGVAPNGLRLGWLAPAYWLHTVATCWGTAGSVSLARVCVYVAGAVAVLVAAGTLFGRRQLEVAGDSVAYAPLHPLLKYLNGVSMALLFGVVYGLKRQTEQGPLGGTRRQSLWQRLLVG